MPQRRPTMWAGQHAVSIFQARCLQLCAHLGNQISHTIWWPWLPTFKAGLAIQRVARARREAARVPARRGPVCTVGTVGTVSASSSVNVSIVANVMIDANVMIVVILVTVVILVLVVVFLVVVVIILVSATGG